MRTLAILLLLGLAGALGLLGLMGRHWLLLAPGLVAGAVLHCMIWAEDIATDWRRGKFWPIAFLLGRDLVGLVAAFALGRLLAALAAGSTYS